MKEVPVSTSTLERVAEKKAAQYGVQIDRRGWRYFPNVKDPKDLTRSDIEGFLRRFYTPKELVLLKGAARQDREAFKTINSWKNSVRSSDGIRVYGGLPAKLDMALQHDFPHEFGMVLNRKSVINVLKVLDSCLPEMMVVPYNTGGTRAS